jgi:hypothetical protein
MGGFHNSLTKILDPIGIVPKVFGSNDPLDLYGGATKAREEATAKEVAEVTAQQEQVIRTNYKNKYGIDYIGSL